VTPTPAPRIIAWVQRGVVMKLTSSVTAGWRAAGGEALADGEADSQRHTADTLDLLERGGVALEDRLAGLGYRQTA